MNISPEERGPTHQSSNIHAGLVVDEEKAPDLSDLTEMPFGVDGYSKEGVNC